MEQAMTLGRMLEIDLDKIGMRQKDLVAKLTDEGEPPLTEQALSNWKRTGRIPRRRLDKLLDILGPASHIAQAHFDGRFIQGTKPGVMQLTAPDMPNVYPDAMPGPGPQHYSMTGETGHFVISKPKVIVQPHNRIRFSEVESQVEDKIAEHLRGAFHKELRVAGLAWRFDFITERSVIELCRSTEDSINQSVYRSLYKLAVAKRVADDGRTFGAILVIPNEYDPASGSTYRPVFNNRNRRLAMEAQIMGLHVEFADSPENAAKIIAHWDANPPTLGGDEYEENY